VRIVDWIRRTTWRGAGSVRVGLEGRPHFGFADFIRRYHEFDFRCVHICSLTGKIESIEVADVVKFPPLCDGNSSFSVVAAGH